MRLKRWSRVVVVVLMCLGALTLIGCNEETTTGSEAGEVVGKALEAFRQSDWQIYVSWMHPEAAARFDSLLRPAFEALIPIDSLGQRAETYQLFGQEQKTADLLAMTVQEFTAFSLEKLIGSVPQLRDALASANYQILGEVPEGGNLRHVLVRTTAEAGGVERIETSVVTTQNSADGWRLTLSSQLEDLARAVRQNLTGQMG